MRTIDTRIRKLEHRFGTSDRKSPLILVVSPAGRSLALDEDRCIEILDECGFPPPGVIGRVQLRLIPDGLNAGELERFLRENGADLTSLGGARNQPAQASVRLHECGPLARKMSPSRSAAADEDNRQTGSQTGGS